MLGFKFRQPLQSSFTKKLYSQEAFTKEKKEFILKGLSSIYDSKENSIIKSFHQTPKLSMEVTLMSYTEPLLVEAYSKVLVKMLEDYLKASVRNIKIEKTEKNLWSILSSPFAHKTAFTQFERRCHSRSFQCYNIDQDVQRRLIWYIEHNAPMDVHTIFTLYTYYKL